MSSPIRSLRIAAALFAACCMPVPPAHAEPAQPAQLPEALRVISCQVLAGTLVPVHGAVGLAVRFENRTAEPFTSIVWRARYKNETVDFTDNGTFSPEERIDNFVLFDPQNRRFDWWGVPGKANAIVSSIPVGNNAPLSFGAYASTSQPSNCSIVRVRRSDGSWWRNPDASAADFRTPPPEPRTEGPVAVSACDFQFSSKAYLQVRFTNESGKTASRVIFRLPYEGGGLDIPDNGTFAPGVAVTHTLHQDLPAAFAPLIYHPQRALANCEVIHVDYEDGSFWQNPAIESATRLPSPPPGALPLQAILSAHWQMSTPPPQNRQ